MVFALIPVVIVVVVVVVLVTRKGGKSAADPTEWPTPETTRPVPTRFADMGKDADPLPASPVGPARSPRAAVPDSDAVPPSPSTPRAAAAPVVPADPASADPAPADPASVGPVPVDRAPVAPVPVDRAPADPAPSPVARDEDPPAVSPSVGAVADPEDDPAEEAVEEPDLSRFGIPAAKKAPAPALEMPKVKVSYLEEPPTVEVEPAAAEVEPPAVEVDPDFEPVVVTEPLDEEVVRDEPVESFEFEEETLVLEFDEPTPAPAEEPAEGPVGEPAATDRGDDADAEVEAAADESIEIVLTDDAPSDGPEVEPPAGEGPEAELDRVIGALIERARETDRSVVEVATELVERANLDEREQADTLATLLDGDERKGDFVDIAQRLSELTLFNDAVPSKPGALTQFAELDPLTRKRVIVRVLCLLVAKSESDLKALPRNPASAAETRQWPLARAVWPVPAKKVGDDADLPSRDFGVRR